jgi:hypothetical protein
MKSVLSLFFFFLFSAPGEASALPGASFQEYSQAYGTPANFKEVPPRNSHEKKVQYYWEKTGTELLGAGKKVSGTLIVLFEKGETGLLSLQETFLAEIPAADFGSVLNEIQDQWDMVSKTKKKNGSGSYDLYHMISKDKKYSAEMSYSSTPAILSSQNRTGLPHTPFLNFWIHLTPAP